MDPVSLVAGAVVATALAVLIYTQRERIGSLRRTVEKQASTARERLTRGAEAAYREAVIDLANGLHIAGHLVRLEQIAVLPHFYTLPKPFDPLEGENPEYDRPHHLLPLVPDWPEAVAPYYIPAIPLTHVLRGESGLAVLGTPGSGRTVALALMALLVARQTEDRQPGDLLNEKRLPVYFHLADVVLETGAAETGVDPLLPMLEAARSHLRGPAGRLLGAVREELAAGRGLILADGWDELPLVQRRRITAWLRVLAGAYPGNKLVVAGPVEGFGPLLDLGLAPAFLRPWAGQEHAELGQRWAQSWPAIGGGRVPASPPADDLIRRAVRGNRARSPLDVTLHIWATFAGDDPGEGRAGWYRAYVKRAAPAPDLIPALYHVAEQTVLGRRDKPPTAVEEGTPEPPEEGTPAAQAVSGSTPLTLEGLTALVNSIASSLHSRPSMSTPDFIYTITIQTHLLSERAAAGLVFTQPAVGAYLAAEALRRPRPRDGLLEAHPASRLVMPFLAEMEDVAPYVQRRLEAPGSILRNEALEIAAWAADADLRAGWRGPVFKRLADLMLRPSEYPAVRERAMAALVASRDPNVAFVFREGLKSSDPRIRMLSVLGLGALGDPEAVVTLGEMIEDPDPAVQVATGLALGAIATKTALNYMIQILLTAGDLARRGVAEMLAATNVAGEGHDVLREAADEADPASRKAAIYGLARIEEPWALELIGEIERRDDQWIVRAAAGGIMDLHRSGERLEPPPAPPQKPEQIGWLGQWIETRGESSAPGSQGIRQLVRALQEGDEAIRLAAAESLGALGAVDAIKPLYAALRDSHPEVRDAAYRALTSISLASGRALPGVM